MADADQYTPVPIRQVAALVAALIQSGQFSGVDISQAMAGGMTLEEIANSLSGVLPSDVVNNGGVLMAGASTIPFYYLSNGSVIMQWTRPITEEYISNGGVLMPAKS
ncbi:hypothetical protein [Acetobacter cerevisiae]|nr:hypothetical protein [Acetobacter cerevisiae]